MKDNYWLAGTNLLVSDTEGIILNSAELTIENPIVSLAFEYREIYVIKKTNCHLKSDKALQSGLYLLL